MGALGFAAVTAIPAWAAVAHVGLFGDRYMVLPLAGVALAWGASTRRRVGQGALLVTCVVLACLSAAAIGSWRDDVSLWTAAAQRHPNPHTSGSLAKTLELQGDLDGAAQWYEQATQAPRPLEHACWNVAAVHLKRGQPGDAAGVGLQALDNGCPTSGELVCPTALGLMWTGRFGEGAQLTAQADSDPAGLCRVVGLVAAAQRGDEAALEAVLQTKSPQERSSLAGRLVRVLEAGGDQGTARRVTQWAQGPTQPPLPR